MRKTLALLATLAFLMIAKSASAAGITIEFYSNGLTCGAGCPTYGDLFIGSSTWAGTQGVGIVISKMKVTGTAFDGIYDVTGAIDITTANPGGYGALQFGVNGNDPNNFVRVIGGVSALGIADTTHLLEGTPGTIGNIVVTAPGGIGCGLCPTVSFTAQDTKDPGLLAALGISGTQFGLAEFSTATGTGNGFSELSADALNTSVGAGTNSITAVPEPATLSLLGLGLLGLGARFHARKR